MTAAPACPDAHVTPRLALMILYGVVPVSLATRMSSGEGALSRG